MANNSRNTARTLRRLTLAQGQAVNLGIFIMQDIVTKVGMAIEADTKGAIESFSRLTAASVTRNRERSIKRIHREAAEDALWSIQEAYRKGVKRGRTPYRVGDRYSGGVLERALISPNMYTEARDGLDFINPRWLDSQAKQWYRMNFGVGPRGSGTRRPGNAKVVIFGQETPIDFALRGYKPGPAMDLPAGFWKSQGGRAHSWSAGRRRYGDQFFPTGKEAIYPTLGFRGSRFLDAGVERLAKTLPIQYMKMMDSYFTEYKKTGGGPISTQKVTLNKTQVNRIQKRIRNELKGIELELRRLPR